MSLGVFLDVDGVLTSEPINIQLARLLNIEQEFRVIEEAFNRQEIDNDGFNLEYIPLFRKAGLSKTFVAERFNELRLRLFAERVLRARCPRYLLSCGPDFFVEPLADNFGISRDRVLCTKYDFDDEGRLLRCVEPVSPTDKQRFATERVGAHLMTIGVGDNLKLDQFFLSECHVKISLGEAEGNDYLFARDLQVVSDTIQHMQEQCELAGVHDSGLATAVKDFWRVHATDNTVFVMMPFRDTADYRELIRTIRETLQEYGFIALTAADRAYHQDLWRNVQTYMIGCTYGIALFCPDMVGEKVGTLYNPNVAMEAGYMFSRGKSVLLLRDQDVPRLFTDLRGFLVEEFVIGKAAETVRPRIESWLQTLPSRIS